MDSIKGTVVFIYPLSSSLKSLYETLVKNEDVEVFEIDSLDEVPMTLQTIGSSIWIGSDPKKFIRFAGINKKIIAQNNCKLIFIGKSKLPIKAERRLEEFNVNDILYEPITEKSLLYKINLSLKSMFQNLEAEDDEFVIKDSEDNDSDAIDENEKLRLEKGILFEEGEEFGLKKSDIKEDEDSFYATKKNKKSDIEFTEDGKEKKIEEELIIAKKSTNQFDLDINQEDLDENKKQKILNFDDSENKKNKHEEFELDLDSESEKKDTPSKESPELVAKNEKINLEFDDNENKKNKHDDFDLDDEIDEKDNLSLDSPEDLQKNRVNLDVDEFEKEREYGESFDEETKSLDEKKEMSPSGDVEKIKNVKEKENFERKNKVKLDLNLDEKDKPKKGEIKLDFEDKENPDKSKEGKSQNTKKKEKGPRFEVDDISRSDSRLTNDSNLANKNKSKKRNEKKKATNKKERSELEVDKDNEDLNLGKEVKDDKDENQTKLELDIDLELDDEFEDEDKNESDDKDSGVTSGALKEREENRKNFIKKITLDVEENDAFEKNNVSTEEFKERTGDGAGLLFDRGKNNENYYDEEKDEGNDEGINTLGFEEELGKLGSKYEQNNNLEDEKKTNKEELDEEKENDGGKEYTATADDFKFLFKVMQKYYDKDQIDDSIFEIFGRYFWEIKKGVIYIEKVEGDELFNSKERYISDYSITKANGLDFFRDFIDKASIPVWYDQTFRRKDFNAFLFPFYFEGKRYCNFLVEFCSEVNEGELRQVEGIIEFLRGTLHERILEMSAKENLDKPVKVNTSGLLKTIVVKVNSFFKKLWGR